MTEGWREPSAEGEAECEIEREYVRAVTRER